MAKSYRHSRTGRHERPYKRAKTLTRHHLTPHSRGGQGTPENILWIYRDKHDVWHKLFGNFTLEESITILQRVARMKGRT